MSVNTIHLAYLHPEAMDERWSFLHRFFHPGILEHDNKAALTCFSMEISHHVFLAIKVRDCTTGTNKKIHIPYSLVAAMLELDSQESQLGFLGQEVSREQQERHND